MQNDILVLLLSISLCHVHVVSHFQNEDWETIDRVTIIMERKRSVEWIVTGDQRDESSVAMVLSDYNDTVALLPTPYTANFKPQSPLWAIFSENRRHSFHHVF